MKDQPIAEFLLCNHRNRRKHGMIQLVLTLCIASLTLVAVGRAEATVAERRNRSLDGAWEIISDPENKGCEAGWHDTPGFAANSGGRKIPVPSCWEEHEQDYEGVAWYRRDFEIPPDWSERHVRLRFDAVNYRAEVWVNGEVVGTHEGGFGSFEFDVTGHIILGKRNTLIVRVVGPAVVSDRIDDLVRNAVPHWRGGYVGGKRVTTEKTFPVINPETAVKRVSVLVGN